MKTKHTLFNRSLPSDWKIVTVNDIKADEPHACVAGPFGSNISSKFFVDDGIPVIRGSNLTDDLTRFVPKGFVFVSKEQALKYRAQHVMTGDLVFTCWGTIGQVGFIPEQGPYPEYIISNKQLKLRPNRNLTHPLYLFYYFASPQMVAHIKARAIGAAVPGINLGILKNLEVVLPPLDTQRRIASILSAYDDLIENNTRRIAILEEMARRIYEEWFVHFRFPGHEKVKMVDSELGKIPEGWEVKPLREILTIYRGKSYKSSELVEEGGLPFINLKCINRDGGFRKDGIKRFIGPYKITHTVKSGDIVVAVTDMTQERRIVARCGRVPRLDNEFGVISMDLIKVVNKNIPINYLYGLLRWSGMPDEVKQHANGANVLHLLPERIEEYLFVSPNFKIAEQFDEIVSPMLLFCDVLEEKNSNLRTTRDFLLPKLISGEIDVSKLPEPEEAAA